MLAIALFLMGCSGNDAEIAVVEPIDTTEAAVTTRSGLECLEGDVFEDSIHDYAEDDPNVGSATIEQAVERYWETGDGQYRDRNLFTEELGPSSASYKNAVGETRLIVRFGMINERWVVESTDSCFTPGVAERSGS